MSGITAPPAPPPPWRVEGNVPGLGAVLAAVAWLPLVAQSVSVKLKARGGFPFAPEYLLLGCAVWIVFMAHRVLDALMDRGPRRERHGFTARHWKVLVVAMLAATCVCEWLLAWHVREIVLRWGLKFAGVVAVYFAVTWLSRQTWAGAVAAGGLAGLLALGFLQKVSGMMWPQMWRGAVAGFLITVVVLSLRHPAALAMWALPRRIFGGLLFATGVALIPYAHIERWPQLTSDSPVLLLGLVCALNSLGIFLWEHAGPDDERRRLAALYPWMLLTAVVGAGMEYFTSNAMIQPVFLACGAAALLLLAVHGLRGKLSACALRTLADAAVILPALAAGVLK